MGSALPGEKVAPIGSITMLHMCTESVLCAILGSAFVLRLCANYFPSVKYSVAPLTLCLCAGLGSVTKTQCLQSSNMCRVICVFSW
jgi:hypothetical protein